MAESRKRRARRRVTIELEANEERLFRNARAVCAHEGLTLRTLVVQAVAEKVAYYRARGVPLDDD